MFAGNLNQGTYWEGEIVLQNTLKEATNSQQADKLQVAANKKMHSLKQHEASKLSSETSVSSRAKTIGWRWLFSMQGGRKPEGQAHSSRFEAVENHPGEIPFTALMSDSSVYICSSGSDFDTLTVNVEYLLLLGGDIGGLEMLKEKLMGRFAITDTGDVSRVLGMQLSRDQANGIMTISEENYVT